MRKVNLRFIGTGYDNYYQPLVKIYDKHHKLVFNEYSYNGRITVCLKDNGCYKIVACLNNSIISSVIFANRCSYEFSFYNCCLDNNNDNITFLLTDYYYSDLPIERGNLILNG